MSSNKSVEKSLRILELISKNPEGITLADIYKELKLPKATAYDILQALYKDDAIYYKDPNLKNYVIGSKIFAIGQAYTKNSNFINFASQGLNAFANKYNLTVFASKRLGDKVTYIYKYESPKTKIITNDVGTQMPLYSNAAGKAFLSFLSDEKRESLLLEIKNKDFNGVETKEYLKLLEDINRFKQLGYVIDNGETEDYLKQIAVPVYNFENKVTGVISSAEINVNGDMNIIKPEQIQELIDVAKYVSEKQGYKKSKDLKNKV